MSDIEDSYRSWRNPLKPQRPMDGALAPAEGSGGGGGGDAAVEGERTAKMGSYKAEVVVVEDPAEEILLLWAILQPTLSKPNAFVRQSSQELRLDACGHHLTILQSPSSMSTPGVTGAVMWDSGVVLGKFLEHAVDLGRLVLQGKKIIELGAGCGLVGCIAALLGGEIILTDLPDRLRLLKKNVEFNMQGRKNQGSVAVNELIWGEDPDLEMIDPLPDFVLGSDVIYSEAAVKDLVTTLRHLARHQTTIFLAGELRNDAVLEYFLEVVREDFLIGHIDQEQWHPEFCSPRVAVFVLVRKGHDDNFR